MAAIHSLDQLGQDRLRQWPQRPPGLAATPDGRDGWLRGRPSDTPESNKPFLKLPGSDRFRTLPDGLWINFGGSVREPFVDIFAIEACSSLTNLLDKRSRFAPSTHSLMVVCSPVWLMAPVSPQDPTPRWRITRVLRAPPVEPLVLPVRDVKVMYALKTRHYEGFASSQVPHAHEYFVPMDALTAKDAHHSKAIQSLVARAAITANFLPPG
jgi:hypothetical protein